MRSSLCRCGFYCMNVLVEFVLYIFFFFKQKTAYEMRISDWSSDVCSSDLFGGPFGLVSLPHHAPGIDEGVAIHDFAHQRLVGGDDAAHLLLDQRQFVEIGRASCRERVCQYV